MDADKRNFWRWVIGLGLFEVLSFVFFQTGQMNAAWLIAAGVLLYVAWRRPRWLAYLSIVEIFVGGKGYLLFIHVGHQTFSLRQLIFVVLLLRFGPFVIYQWRQLWQRAAVRAVTWLALWVVAMVGWGWWRGYNAGTIFLDANAFAALAYMPLWFVNLPSIPNWRRQVMTIGLAGATTVGLKSLLAVYLFGHSFPFLDQVYHWIRQTGIGEITLMNDNVYRVFFQGQVMDLMVVLVLIAAMVKKELPRWQWIPLVAAACGVYISLSRSFWLGLGIGLLVLVITLLRQQPRTIVRLGWLLPIGIFCWLLTAWAINFPRLTGGQVNPILSRLQSSGSAEASTARVNQIRPLLTTISHHPIIGSGFGTAVTYYSTDPRVRGWRTTTAFELGYLDLWLKIGLVGLVLYGWWLKVILRDTTRRGWLGLTAAITALLAVHLTSPYLNHPLGLGWLALSSLLIYD